ncbi:lysine-rich nucleolar protein 1 isoform X2 [Tachyglossus aculeatus]|uniref:lysine-rich nucleolar protein 1 isoform X2 n=1 Tax=Tachyglossus aculeatus TaxID=9261 RepID=UPI0018F620C5|nr:lysine-rich nucleolar protein 1 isoform X2 [Tachyglossus aculeatus]
MITKANNLGIHERIPETKKNKAKADESQSVIVLEDDLRTGVSEENSSWAGKNRVALDGVPQLLSVKKQKKKAKAADSQTMIVIDGDSEPTTPQRPKSEGENRVSEDKPPGQAVTSREEKKKKKKKKKKKRKGLVDERETDLPNPVAWAETSHGAQSGEEVDKKSQRRKKKNKKQGKDTVFPAGDPQAGLAKEPGPDPGEGEGDRPDAGGQARRGLKRTPSQLGEPEDGEPVPKKKKKKKKRTTQHKEETEGAAGDRDSLEAAPQHGEDCQRKGGKKKNKKKKKKKAKLTLVGGRLVEAAAEQPNREGKKQKKRPVMECPSEEPAQKQRMNEKAALEPQGPETEQDKDLEVIAVKEGNVDETNIDKARLQPLGDFRCPDDRPRAIWGDGPTRFQDDKLVIQGVGARGAVSLPQVRRKALQEEIDRESGKTEAFVAAEVEPATRFGQWDTAAFDNADQKMKFLRLMGGFKKSSPSLSHPPATTAAAAAAGKPNMALNKKGAESLRQNLQMQFDKALSWKQSRGMGLGFSSAAKKTFFIDKSASKSVKFEY